MTRLMKLWGVGLGVYGFDFVVLGRVLPKYTVWGLWYSILHNLWLGASPSLRIALSLVVNITRKDTFSGMAGCLADKLPPRAGVILLNPQVPLKSEILLS